MAFSKNNKRQISVDNKIYYWSATGNDNWISLSIASDTEGSPRLSCMFDYHHIPIKNRTNNQKIIHLTNQFVITPYTVRQVIEYALSIGWKPFSKGQDLNLRHIDDKIDLRLDQNRANALKESVPNK